MDADAERLFAELAIDLDKSAKRPRQVQDGVQPEVSAEAVSRVIKARQERSRYLPQHLFSEPNWDMLLDLLHAEISFRRVTVTDLCIASGVPSTTALRYLKSMVQQGMITRRADHLDGRRNFVELTPEFSNALRLYFAEVVEAQAPNAGLHANGLYSVKLGQNRDPRKLGR